MGIKKRFDLVIFDWAGTVVDFGCEAPVRALIEAFAAEGIALDAALARREMGRAKSDHVRGLLAEPRVAAAWCERHLRAPQERDVEVLIARLQPLMRNYAAAASTLIPGARATFETLRAAGVRVASSTGYTRDMLNPVLERTALQGYRPEHVVCSGETLAGRPAPLMIYKACVDLGIWPLSRVVKVDDSETGVEEGKASGAFTVGVASGNTLALSQAQLHALPQAEREQRLLRARQALTAAGADVAVNSIADLVPALEAAAR